ncbi:hypothetical protein DSL72_008395 [Monilinia vaccinii-corymbosi]|uniref:Uncharacterized protein n=1 Tax=Monilinia vaccinii-corymbosi TaxID=61207 RepID=A0A8A3PKJ8_9HELO|nr:hypothetical protein DSL72_008395 [Monilinia vaccinii-corymbosi]
MCVQNGAVDADADADAVEDTEPGGCGYGYDVTWFKIEIPNLKLDYQPPDKYPPAPPNWATRKMA